MYGRQCFFLYFYYFICWWTWTRTHAHHLEKYTLYEKFCAGYRTQTKIYLKKKKDSQNRTKTHRNHTKIYWIYLLKLYNFFLKVEIFGLNFLVVEKSCTKKEWLTFQFLTYWLTCWRASEWILRTKIFVHLHHRQTFRLANT